MIPEAEAAAIRAWVKLAPKGYGQSVINDGHPELDSFLHYLVRHRIHNGVAGRFSYDIVHNMTDAQLVEVYLRWILGGLRCE